MFVFVAKVKRIEERVFVSVVREKRIGECSFSSLKKEKVKGKAITGVTLVNRLRVRYF